MIIAAVESLGYVSDRRILALNSYENRVYQVGIESGAPLVAKFYRPQRWSAAAIAEEHGFALELAAAEIPVVPPLVQDGRTLFEYDGFGFAVFERRGGRWPELGTRTEREWMGRFLGRIHLVGRRQRFRHRGRIDIERLGQEPRDYLLAHDWIPPHLQTAYESLTADLLNEIRAAFDTAHGVAEVRLHGDCHRGNVLWTDAGPHFVDLDDCLMGPAIQDLWMLLSGTRREMSEQLTHLLEGYSHFADVRCARAGADREPAHAAHDSLLGVAGAPLERSGVPGGVPLVHRAALLGEPGPGAARAAGCDCGRAARTVGSLSNCAKCLVFVRARAVVAFGAPCNGPE